MRLGHEILPGRLYQRGLFPAGWSDERKGALLDKHNVRVFVTLVNKVDEGVQRWMWEHGRNYIYHPIPDGKNVDEVMLPLARKVAMIMDHGGSAVTQCRAGRNRSALLSVLVLRELGHSTEGAINLVRQQRPRALANEHFEAWLRAL